ncbi:MAG: glutathione S-transferase [Pseudomonadota bacterium]
MSANAIKLYTFSLSGHAHRVRLMLSLLELPTELIEVNLAKGEQKQAEFLAMNPFGQVPVMDDNGVVVADSNAILVYLARTYGGEAWLPGDAAGMAAVQRWLSVAAGPIAYGPALARAIVLFGSPYSAAESIARAHAVLKVIQGELAQRDWLVGQHVTIADVAAYTYIAHAPEGNVSLADYPAVRAWLARVEALPNFVGLQKSAVGLAA